MRSRAVEIRQQFDDGAEQAQAILGDKVQV